MVVYDRWSHTNAGRSDMKALLRVKLSERAQSTLGAVACDVPLEADNAP